MSDVVFHIGFPKTATTTLQTALMRRLAWDYLGKPLRDSRQPSDSLEIARAVFFADTRRFEAMLPELRAMLSRRVDASGRVIVSDEAFTMGEHMRLGPIWQRQVVTDHDHIAARLHRIWPEALVLMSTREQTGFIRSFFRQQAKTGKVHDTFEGYVQREIDALPHRSMLHLLRYDEAFDAYASRFGDARVLVSMFEAYRSDFGGYLDEIAAFCGLDAAILREAWQGLHANDDLAYSRRVQRLRRRLPSRLVALVPESIQARTRVAFSRKPVAAEWSAAQREAVAAAVAPSNAALAARTGLDLAAHGYAMPEALPPAANAG